MPTKVLLEWPTKNENDQRAWNRVKVPLHPSKRGNLFVEHEGRVYVFEGLKEGCPVVSLVDGKWVEVGRVTFDTIFLGSTEEQSYEEWLRSSEGEAWRRELLEYWRKTRGLYVKGEGVR